MFILHLAPAPDSGVSQGVESSRVEVSGARAQRGAVAASGGCSASLSATQLLPTWRTAWAGAGGLLHLGLRTRVHWSCWGLEQRRDKLRCDPFPVIAIALSCASFCKQQQRVHVWIFVEKGAATGRSQSPAELVLPWAAVKQLREKDGLED